MHRWSRLLVFLCFAFLASCLEPRQAINRVQPDFLDKSDLIPVQYAALAGGAAPAALTAAMLAREPAFFMQTTMIAKPTTTGFVGLTSYSEIDKIRWEVTENFLVGRRTFSYVRNAPQGETGIGQNVQVGDVLAVFAIRNHFDIRRDFNTSTGEEFNVIVENTTDRPWYQRRYMRVDWSRNLIEGYHSVFEFEEWQGLVRSEPVPVFVNTPNDPLRPVFEYRDVGQGRRELAYFDVVNRAVLHPETANLGPDFPNIPVCWLGDGEKDCAPSEVTFRVSFRRHDPTRDYEPAILSVPPAAASVQPRRLDMDRFGFFDANRIGYDRGRQATLETERVHYATRHNLWQWHHAPVYGEETATLCNADADCAAGTICKIGNTPRDATHRGVCARWGLQHLGAPGAIAGNDISCRTDDDCRALIDGRGVSNTAVCDTATNTCGERFLRCTQDSDCASVDPQSSCDLGIAYTRPDNRGLCLLPFRQRQVRPVAYHESPNYPERMQAVTDVVVGQWNTAFRRAVTEARRHECHIERGIDASTARPESDECNAPEVTGLAPALGADAQFPFVGCHNPVWGTNQELPGYHTEAEVQAAHDRGWDLAACGPQGTSARLGDLRYSMIGAINDHDADGYWGLANIAADPESGEMIAGRGAVWQTITDSYAAYLVDLVRLLNGDLTEEQFSEGAQVVQSMRQLGTGQTPADAALDAPLRSAGALENIASGMQTMMDRHRLQDSGWLRPEAHLPFHSHGARRGAFELTASRLRSSRVLGDNSNRALQRAAMVRDTDLEGAMMNADQVRLSRSARPDGTAALPSTIAEVSPFRARSPALRHARERFRRRLRAWQCNYEAAFADDVLFGLAQRMARGEPIRASNPADADAAFGQDWDFRPGGTPDYATMLRYARSFIHQGVLAHEIGHSLGQRHNFAGSADTMNFNDRYWQLRGRGHRLGLRPRYDYLSDPMDGRYYSNEERDGRIEEYAYASVMDYKGFNEDAHGLGRYDYAFIANGYVGLVDAFRTVASVDGALMYSVQFSGSGNSTPFDLRQWAMNGPVKGLHYTHIPTIFGRRGDGLPNIQDDNRYQVFLRETTSREIPGWGDPDFTNVTRDGHVLVPYFFDSDERAGLVWQNQPNDSGADAYESMHYVSERYLNYYFANSFARFRTGFNTSGYAGRMWGRYVEQLRQSAQTLAFDVISNQDFFSDAPGYAAYANDPAERGMFINQLAMSTVADAFVNQLAMPEFGPHALTTQPDGLQLVTPRWNGMIEVPINSGRAFESAWRFEAGYFWWEQFNRAGSYYDKTMALEAFADPELSLVGRDTPTDIRLFQLSFYSMFPDQTLRLWGALLSEDWQDYAPIINLRGNNELARTHLATLNLPAGTGAGRSGRVLDSTHQAIDPQDHFTMQLWSAVYGGWLFPATYDQRYMDYARLWVDGADEAIDVVDPDRNTITFVDPWSQRRYRAMHFGTGPGELGERVGASGLVHVSTGMVAQEAGVAARCLLHAQDLDAQRLRAVAAGNRTRAAQLEQEERKYIDLLNVLRRVTSLFGSGTL